MAAKRVLVLGLDGLPHSLAGKLTTAGVMPNLGRLLSQGSSLRMRTVIPTISNVAWGCFLTGKNPGKTGVYGFAELDERFELRIPNASDIAEPTLYDIVSKAGKRVIGMGVPMTYPPRPVNGIVVGCFLAPSLDKAVYPPEVLGKLNALGYRIDIDPVAARESVENLRQEVPEVLDGRIRTLLSFIEREAWDLLVCHVMETDRVMHFLWRYYEEGRGENHDFFLSFYRRLDEGIGKAVAAVGDDTEIMVLSDHGFCGIKAEVQLNRWLAREGFLTLAGDPADGFAAVCPASKAVALVPGRIHILRP